MTADGHHHKGESFPCPKCFVGTCVPCSVGNHTECSNTDPGSIVGCTCCVTRRPADQFMWDQPGVGHVPLRGLCGYCGVNVDSTDPNHRVTSIMHGGRGVECVLRGDIPAHLGGPLRAAT